MQSPVVHVIFFCFSELGRAPHDRLVTTFLEKEYEKSLQICVYLFAILSLVFSIGCVYYTRKHTKYKFDPIEFLPDASILNGHDSLVILLLIGSSRIRGRQSTSTLRLVVSCSSSTQSCMEFLFRAILADMSCVM